MRHLMIRSGGRGLMLLVAAIAVCLFALHGVHAQDVLPPLASQAHDLGPAMIMFGIGSIQQLREERAELAKQMTEMHEKTPKADWKKKEISTKWDELDAKVADLDGQITREQRLLDMSAERTFDDITKPNPAKPSADPKAQRSRELYQKWLRVGDKGLSSEEHAEIRNTMSTTTPSEGGYTVQTEVAKTVADAIKAYGNVRADAEVIQTAQGNPMNWPNSDGTAETGEQIAENQTATDADASFGSTALNTFKYSSKVITVPFELLQDSVINVEDFVNGRLVQRLARITNQKFTVGAGTTEPRGFVTAAGVGKVGTTGQTATVVYDDLVDLVHSVDPAYRDLGRCKFQMNDDSLRIIRKLKDTAGRPIFIPGYDNGLQNQKQPDRLLGYPVSINQFMATMAANAKSIVFGDLFFYKVRDVLQVTLFRFTDSVYAKKGQVGFMAWMRAGGNFVDVGAGLKYYQNSAT